MTMNLGWNIRAYSRAIHLMTGIMMLLALAPASQAQMRFGPRYTGPQVTLTQNHLSSTYAIGETIKWTVEATGDSLFNYTAVPYNIRKNGLTIYKEGAIDLSSGTATIETSLNEPGAVLLEVITVDPATVRRDGLNPAPGVFPDGAMIAPDQLKPSQPRPADFDAFWDNKIAELNKLPMNAQLQPGDSGNPDVDYYTIRMDNIRGSHIYGQLAKPAKEGKHPALLIVQWAGVYGLQKSWVTNRAASGWLTLNIEAHDLPGDQPPEYYRALQDSLGNYYTMGNTDREQSYFLRMYLSCYRAVEYLSQRPDWDGETLVVMGNSQGGQQSFITAGLNPKVTAMMPCVPAGCDVAGPTNGRAAGFPDWAKEAQAENNPEIYKVGAYFDPIYFASRITCPALIGMGLFDDTCPPTGVYTAINQLKWPKKILLMHSPHQNWRNSQEPYNTDSEIWLNAMVEMSKAK